MHAKIDCQAVHFIYMDMISYSHNIGEAQQEGHDTNNQHQKLVSP